MSDKHVYKQIYLCSSDLKSEELARCVGIFFGIEAVKLTDDPCLLRRVLEDADKDRLVVIDCIQASMDSRNIAQALLSDGHNIILLKDQGDLAYVERLENQYPERFSFLERDSILHTTADNDVKPSRDIVIPDEEYGWDKLRNKLSKVASSHTNANDKDYDELDEVEGIVFKKSTEERGLSVSRPSLDASAHKGKSIAFCSGRGGVGKTTLVAVAGALASSWGLSVALLDLNLFCGNLYMCFGEPSIASLTSIRDTDGNFKKLISDYMQKVSKNTNLYLYGALDHPEEAELVVPYYELLLNGLLQNFDLVLIDMPTTWNEQDVRILRQVDRMVVVADERASSVSSMVRTMNLANRLGVVRTKMIRLINRCDSYGFDQKFIQKAEEGSYCPHTFYVEDGGRQIPEMLSAGKVLQLIRMRNACVKTCSESFKTILNDIGVDVEEKEDKEASYSILSSIFSIFHAQKSSDIEEG